MSIRLEMLQAARLAPKLLGESVELVRAFLLAQQTGDGGFKDRAETSDLYYTVFGIDALFSIESVVAPLHRDKRDSWKERAAGNVARYGTGEGLDFVHLCCLARCWAGLNQSVNASDASAVLRRVEAFRTSDGGYNGLPNSRDGTAYGCFLALGAYQDLGCTPPNPGGMIACLDRLRTANGAWANDLNMRVPSANSTAAAVTVLRNLGQPIDPAAGDWLMAQAHPQGGFLAAPGAPVPDLLTTATALHALAGMGRDFSAVKEPCLDFLDSLWTNQGAFHGSWLDDTLDTEYTFYGLLALGHLSL